VELAADGDSPVCGKAPSGETGPTGAEGGAASVGALPVGASRGRDVPRAAPSGRPPPVAQLLTSPVPSSSTATARATPRRPRPGPTHLPAATSAPVATAEPTEVVQTHRSPARRPSLPVAHRTSSTIRSGWAAGARCPGRPGQYAGPTRAGGPGRPGQYLDPAGCAGRPPPARPSAVAVFQGDEPERIGPRAPIRPSGNPTARITRAAAGITGAFKTILPPAASLPSSGPRANGRDLGLAQLQPGVVHWTASDQQGALWPRNFDVSLLLVPGACQALRSGVS